MSEDDGYSGSASVGYSARRDGYGGYGENGGYRGGYGATSPVTRAPRIAEWPTFCLTGHVLFGLALGSAGSKYASTQHC
ncbi:MAG: hypothetical protein R3E01_09565 [Pirellulaceae bacterium]|nr:hypothetical protein [Planctomycetales bacterium]